MQHFKKTFFVVIKPKNKKRNDLLCSLPNKWCGLTLVLFSLLFGCDYTKKKGRERKWGRKKFVKLMTQEVINWTGRGMGHKKKMTMTTYQDKPTHHMQHMHNFL